MEGMPKYTCGITHSGPFHADDVFAGATLRILYGNDFKISRLSNYQLTDDMFQNSNVIIFDIGGKRSPFDHHYTGSPVRQYNNMPYSSFGLVWNKLAVYKYSPELIEKVDKKLVVGVDAVDCGVDKPVSTYDVYSIADLIGHMTPLWTEPSGLADFNRLYEQAVTVAKRVLLRLIAYEQSKMEAYSIVQEAFEDSISSGRQILVLDKSVPWKSILFDLEQKYPQYNHFIKYAIYPSVRDGYQVMSVPLTAPNDRSNRAPFPQEWHVSPKLASKDATFVHQNYFCGGATTIEGALEMAAKGLRYHGFIK